MLGLKPFCIVLVGPRQVTHNGCDSSQRRGCARPHTPEGAGTFRKQRGMGGSKARAFTILSAGRTEGGSKGDFDQASPWPITRGC